MFKTIAMAIINYSYSVLEPTPSHASIFFITLMMLHGIHNYNNLQDAYS